MVFLLVSLQHHPNKGTLKKRTLWLSSFGWFQRETKRKRLETNRTSHKKPPEPSEDATNHQKATEPPAICYGCYGLRAQKDLPSSLPGRGVQLRQGGRVPNASLAVEKSETRKEAPSGKRKGTPWPQKKTGWCFPWVREKKKNALRHNAGDSM